MEAQRRLRIAGELLALGAFEICVENEAFDIDVLQQYHAHVGEPAGINRRERHGIGIVRLLRLGFGKPFAKDPERLVVGDNLVSRRCIPHWYKRLMAPPPCSRRRRAG
jgi:hypothetical protein